MIGVVVPFVQGVHFPIFNVDVLNTAHEQLQFVLVEYFDYGQRDQFAETVQKRVHLLLHSSHETPLDYTPENHTMLPNSF